MTVRALVTGGGGFLGSHLCRALRARDVEVVTLDSFVTGRPENLKGLIGTPGFTLLEHDVVEGIPVEGDFDAVLHLASPASPPDYLARPILTLETGAVGTKNALEVARRSGARFLLASTSEVYGDPEVHPQPESYRGNVTSVGPRSSYDEAKRYAEAISMAYYRVHDVDVKIVRLFNTYGPGLSPGDGRVVSNFLVQAIDGQPLTVYGDGSQTRCFCYVDDIVRGLLALLDSSFSGAAMNLGNPDEWTVLELAELVLELTGSKSEIVFQPLPTDDPTRRQPDITLARTVLGWQPEIDLRDGLVRLYDWYRAERG